MYEAKNGYIEVQCTADKPLVALSSMGDSKAIITIYFKKEHQMNPIELEHFMDPYGPNIMKRVTIPVNKFSYANAK